jgi:hypothetical protein
MGGNSKWDADTKTDKTQHRRDIVGFRTSSCPNHEDKRDKELYKKQAKKDKKAAAKAAGKFFY